MARLTEAQWMAVRAEWESSPQQGLGWLVTANGGPWAITEEAIRRRRLKEGWTKRGTMSTVAEKAQLEADKKSAKTITKTPVPDVGTPELPQTAAPGSALVGSEVGSKPVGPTLAELRELEAVEAEKRAIEERREEAERKAVERRAIAEAERHQAERSAISEDAAVGLRAALLERHRSEWQMARQLAYEAVKGRDFDKAKLAKITTETIRNIQDGERKAWGLDITEPAAPGSTNTVVVIERTTSAPGRVIDQN